MRGGSSRSWDSGSTSSVVVVWILIGKSKVSRTPVSGCRRMEHEYGRSTDTAAGELVYDFWILLGSGDGLQWVEMGPELEVVVCGSDSDSGCDLLITLPTLDSGSQALDCSPLNS